MIELALVLPVLVLLICGILDFGTFFLRSLTVRNGTHQAGRAAAVADYGSSTGCALFPAPSTSPTTERLMCLTKEKLGVTPADARVKITFSADGYQRGKPVAICTEYQATSVTGLFGTILEGRAVRNKTEHRLEQIDAANPLIEHEEQPLVGDWSWCTA